MVAQSLLSTTICGRREATQISHAGLVTSDLAVPGASPRRPSLLVFRKAFLRTHPKKCVQRGLEIVPCILSRTREAL